MPDFVPRNERAEQSAAARDGTTVGDGDLGERDVLGDGAALTGRVALRSRWTASARHEGARCDEEIN